MTSAQATAFMSALFQSDPPSVDEVYNEFIAGVNSNKQGFKVNSVVRSDDGKEITVQLYWEDQDMIVVAELSEGHWMVSYSGTWMSSTSRIPIPQMDNDDSDSMLDMLSNRKWMMEHYAGLWDRRSY